MKRQGRVSFARRYLLLSVCGLVPRMLATSPKRREDVTNNITPVAIRWDSWYSDQGNAVFAQNALLGPKWHARAPWFAAPEPVRSPDAEQPKTGIGSQQDMDLEIQLASAAGIKAWGFDMYLPSADGSSAGDANFSRAFHMYQTSHLAHLMKWCGIVTAAVLGTSSGFAVHKENWQKNVLRWVSFFQDNTYLKLNGRPVLFIVWNDAELSGWFSGEISNARLSLDYLRAECRRIGVGNPFVVVMAGPPTTSAEKLYAIGADAISNYIPDLKYRASPETFEDLISQTKAFWNRELAASSSVVPVVQTGADERPRYDRPAPWVKLPKQPLDSRYFKAGTPQQVANLMSEAINFISSNQKACSSKLLLIYSWNEFDEGGSCLCPTVSDPPINSPPPGMGGPNTSRMLCSVGPVLRAAG